MKITEHVIMGMSGGVDSSVAAYVLLEAGYRVEGLFMKNWEEDDDEEYCSAAQDLADAKAVCERLAIPLHTVNFSHEYWERVFEHFLAEYRSGRTPNPDVICNKEIKFKAFLDHALQLGADRIATGHYARTDKTDDGVHLLRGADRGKDQTYFLHTLGQHELSHALFPIGGLLKTDVRALAKRLGFVNHAKKDSTGICFIGERRFGDFLRRYLPATPGEMVTVDGGVIGEHDGLMYYTIGQRHGLGLGGQRGAEEAPWFVADKDLARNRLVVVQGHDHPLLLSRGLLAESLHWIRGSEPALPLACSAKIRYRQDEQACRVTRTDDGIWRIDFHAAQRAVTPGQSVVLYDGEECLGGGVIQARIPVD